MQENQEIEIESIGQTFQHHDPYSFEEQCERSLAGSDNFYNRSKNAGFSVWALLFGPFYYLYRKMYLEGILLMAILSILPIPPQLSMVVWLIEGLAFYPLYRMHAKRKISKLLSKHSDLSVEEQLSVIHSKGGVNYFVALIFAALYFMVLFALLGNA